MTNNESPEAPSAMPALASALLDADDVDILDALAALRPLLTPAAFDELAILCDMCPMHMQDIDSCRDDDEPECRDMRAAL